MNDIASPEQLFTFLSIDQESISVSQRERAQMLLDGVASEICSYTKMRFTRKIETLTLSGTGHSLLVLDDHPVWNISLILEGSSVVNPDDYDWSKEGVIERRWGIWCKRLSHYKVTVDHGWDEVPSSIRLVCMRVAARGYANPTGLVQESAGGWSGGYGFDSSRFVALTDTDRAQIREGFMNR